MLACISSGGVLVVVVCVGFRLIPSSVILLMVAAVGTVAAELRRSSLKRSIFPLSVG
jgi:hypothetical protein